MYAGSVIAQWAADPDTMSGKADRAHRYGIPVVHPAAFARLLATVTS